MLKQHQPIIENIKLHPPIIENIKLVSSLMSDLQLKIADYLPIKEKNPQRFAQTLILA